MAFLYLAVVLYAGSIAFIRFRGNANFPFARQLSDFSTFMVPFNIPAYALSKVPNGPRMGAEQFPQLQLLQDNWETIRDEAMALYGQGHIATKDDLPGSSFYRDNRWKSFYIKIYDNDIPSAWSLAPKTRALIEQVPGMNLALFAMLMPGKRLSQHHDPFAFTLRYSLGLSTPNSEQCGLLVDGQTYHWKDGDSIVFDETYLHAAYNDTETPRIILMTDIDRPLKSRLMQKLYYLFGRFFNSLFYVDNVDASITGIGNRMTRPVKQYKVFMKGLKRRNRRLYKTGKWALGMGIIASVGYALV